MATREEMSLRIQHDLADRDVLPSDPSHEFVRDSMETMNQGVADLDDELADITGRLAWLAQAPTWINRRELDEFDGFVNAKLAECERTIAAVRARWEKHQAEKRNAPRALETT